MSTVAARRSSSRRIEEAAARQQAAHEAEESARLQAKKQAQADGPLPGAMPPAVSLSPAAAALQAATADAPLLGQMRFSMADPLGPVPMGLEGVLGFSDASDMLQVLEMPDLVDGGLVGAPAVITVPPPSAKAKGATRARSGGASRARGTAAGSVAAPAAQRRGAGGGGRSGAPSSRSGTSRGSGGAAAGGKRSAAPKQKWTDEEETALRAGVAKYGPGKWRSIQKDTKLGPLLATRSNVDLKDKWRNICVNPKHGGGRTKGGAGRSGVAAGQGATAAADAGARGRGRGTAARARARGRGGAGSKGDAANGGERAGGAATVVRTAIPRKYDRAIVAALSLRGTPLTAAAMGKEIMLVHEVPSTFKSQLAKHLKRMVEEGAIARSGTSYSLLPGVAAANARSKAAAAAAASAANGIGVAGNAAAATVGMKRGRGAAAVGAVPPDAQGVFPLGDLFELNGKAKRRAVQLTEAAGRKHELAAAAFEEAQRAARSAEEAELAARSAAIVAEAAAEAMSRPNTVASASALESDDLGRPPLKQRSMVV
eukprot:PRCOL_00004959-RA